MRVFLSDISVMEEKLIGQYKEVLEVTGSLVEVQYTDRYILRILLINRKKGSPAGKPFSNYNQQAS
jgi:hypothetical protein